MHNLLKADISEEVKEKELILRAINGSRESLEVLIQAHQTFIYNIAWKFLYNPEDALDATQEVLLKVIINLSQFNFKSKFRTWLYRITFNHLLDMKKRPMEMREFEDHQKTLESIPDEQMSTEDKFEMKDQIKEVKTGCMAGLLLCLEREQRLIYIIGAIFKVNHNLGAELLNISKTNFRKKLSRARKSLHNFIDNKCGLIDKHNSCKCYKKTKGFIKNGYVNPDNFLFKKDYLKKVKDITFEKGAKFNKKLVNKCDELFANQPYDPSIQDKDFFVSILKDHQWDEIFSVPVD
jgi:RNA polymerase sigma factor (sigma-70 family)